MTPQPYYADEHVQLFHGDFRDLANVVLNGREPDLVMADPPYGETQLEWDTWPIGWPSIVPGRSMWCFGSMRMFMDRRDEFAGWRMSQDTVWRKHRRSDVTTDRFARIHELVLHWYRGPWGEVHHECPKVAHYGPRVATARRAIEKNIRGSYGAATWEDDGSRWQPSVIDARAMHRNGAINETEKPVGLVEQYVTYGCPPGGLVLDVFAGSCSSLVAARATGRQAIGFELRESQCESAARRLSQGDLFAGLGDAS